jgi:hypothetical protein
MRSKLAAEQFLLGSRLSPHFPLFDASWLWDQIIVGIGTGRANSPSSSLKRAEAFPTDKEPDYVTHIPSHDFDAFGHGDVSCRPCWHDHFGQGVLAE